MKKYEVDLGNKGSSAKLAPTSPDVFWNRRDLVKAMAVTTAAASLDPLSGPLAAQDEADSAKVLAATFERPKVFPAERNAAFPLPARTGSKPTPRVVAGMHNNFYEFLPGRGGPVWQFVDDFEVEPWKVEITGLVNKPMTLDLDDLFAIEHEERLYHFRCVERWAMNVPWSGFPLSKLLEKVEPKAEAKFVRFETANLPKQMPGIKEAHWYPWPYHEALRIDEAMNELAMVVTGAYGVPLVRQHGAPVRIIVPWKYGYKSPKSIVKMELVAQQPKTFWQIQEHEYGFLSNVNPNIPHPRWSQAQSYWLEDRLAFQTQMFNGYGKWVAGLYPDEPTEPQKPLVPGQTAR